MIVGITGTIGAGKGTAVEYLVSRYGFTHYSVRDFLVEEIKKRNLPPTRDSMVFVGNDLRKEHGASYIMEQLFNQIVEKGSKVVIESLRSPLEVTYLKRQKNFVLFAVDAPSRVRYERISKRGKETDRISYEQFLAEDKREMENTDSAEQNIRKCIEIADYVIANTTTIESFYIEIDRIMADLGK